MTPDSTLAVTNTCPKDGVHLSQHRRRAACVQVEFPGLGRGKSGTDEPRAEAARLVALPGPTIPWYLRQQALLFLAFTESDHRQAQEPGPETKRG